MSEETDNITPEAALRILDAQSIRRLREALIEALPPQSPARVALVDVETLAEVERGKIRKAR